MAFFLISTEASLRPYRSILKSLNLFLVITLLTSGCGGPSKTTLVKDYRLAVSDDDPAMKDQFRRLISDFNDFVGLDALIYTADVNNANSTIVLTSGLKQRDGKVGWGQWISESTSKASFLGKSGTRTVKYRMQLEFDRHYFESRLNSVSDEDNHARHKLFFHEVGHGLQMSHHTDSTDIMYYDIGGTKDPSNFFTRVREYIAAR